MRSSERNQHSSATAASLPELERHRLQGPPVPPQTLLLLRPSSSDLPALYSPASIPAATSLRATRRQVGGVPIHWHRRDIRPADNVGLASAAEAASTADAAADDAIVPLFVLDDALLVHAGASRVTFLLDALRSLRAWYRERDSDLLVIRGDPRLDGAIGDVAPADRAGVPRTHRRSRPAPGGGDRGVRTGPRRGLTRSPAGRSDDFLSRGNS